MNIKRWHKAIKERGRHPIEQTTTSTTDIAPLVTTIEPITCERTLAAENLRYFVWYDERGTLAKELLKCTGWSIALAIDPQTNTLFYFNQMGLMSTAYTQPPTDTIITTPINGCWSGTQTIVDAMINYRRVKPQNILPLIGKELNRIALSTLQK